MFTGKSPETPLLHAELGLIEELVRALEAAEHRDVSDAQREAGSAGRNTAACAVIEAVHRQVARPARPDDLNSHPHRLAYGVAEGHRLTYSVDLLSRGYAARDVAHDDRRLGERAGAALPRRWRRRRR